MDHAHILSPSMSAMQHEVTFFGQRTDHTGSTRPVSDSGSHLQVRGGKKRDSEFAGNHPLWPDHEHVQTALSLLISVDSLDA